MSGDVEGKPLSPGKVVGVMVILALGLVFFYAFSAPYGDGLEVTMEEGEAEEGEPVYEGPLGYGDDHISSWVMGMAGFVVLVGLFWGLGRLLPDSGDTGDEA